MKGAIESLIQHEGEDYTVRNATASGARDAATYSDDGTIRAVLEQRSRPRTVTDSAGTEIEADRELRAIVDSGQTLRTADADNPPSKLVHPDGPTYRLLDRHYEDSAVDVLLVTLD